MRARYWPPSITIVCPVIDGVSRMKRIARAMSSGVQPRFSGLLRWVRSKSAWLCLPLMSAMPDPRDRIEDALDYDFIRAGIMSIVKNRHFNLQETLCQEILELCLGRGGIRRAKVSTRKPDVYPDCKSIGFEMEAEVATR